jgi:hypothetical protein
VRHEYEKPGTQRGAEGSPSEIESPLLKDRREEKEKNKEKTPYLLEKLFLKWGPPKWFNCKYAVEGRF